MNQHQQPVKRDAPVRGESASSPPDSKSRTSRLTKDRELFGDAESRATLPHCEPPDRPRYAWSSVRRNLPGCAKTRYEFPGRDPGACRGRLRKHVPTGPVAARSYWPLFIKCVLLGSSRRGGLFLWHSLFWPTPGSRIRIGYKVPDFKSVLRLKPFPYFQASALSQEIQSAPALFEEICAVSWLNSTRVDLICQGADFASPFYPPSVRSKGHCSLRSPQVFFACSAVKSLNCRAGQEKLASRSNMPSFPLPSPLNSVKITVCRTPAGSTSSRKVQERNQRFCVNDSSFAHGCA